MLFRSVLLLPCLPTALVPYLPTRYTAIPYAGFLLLVAGAVELVLGRAPAPARRLRRAGLTAAVVPLAMAGAVGMPARTAIPYAGLLLLGIGTIALGLGPSERVRRLLRVAVAAALVPLAVTGALRVRFELADAERVSAAHARLLAEAKPFAARLPVGPVIAVVRAERESPLEVVAAEPIGLFKPYFIRGGDPYGLIAAAALFDWLGERDDLLARAVPVAELGRYRVLGPVLVHESGRFRAVQGDEPTRRAVLDRLGAAGMPGRFFRLEPAP